jgi:hypothetical protein
LHVTHPAIPSSISLAEFSEDFPSVTPLPSSYLSVEIIPSK